MAGYPNCSQVVYMPPVNLTTTTAPLPSNLTAAPMPVDLYPLMSIYFNGHVTIFVIVFGIASNLLAFLAFFSHAVPRPNIYVYLMALCLWDSLLLVSAGLLYALPNILFERKRIVGLYIQVLPLAFYLSNTTLIGSLWMIVALCVDRYVALCHPLRHRKLSRKASIRRTLIFISIAIALYSLPHLFDFKIRYCFDRRGELDGRILLSEMRNNFYYRTFYKIIGGLLFYSLCPFVLLTILTILISIRLRIASQKRSAMMQERESNSACTMQRLTKDRTNNNGLLLVVIIKFMICHFLPTSLDVAEAIMATSFPGPRFITYLVDISNFLVVLNASTSTWLYFYYSSTFRADCRRVLVQCELCPKQISALRAAAPVFRATLRWNGALFVGPNADDDVNIFAENAALSKRRSAIPSIRSNPGSHHRASTMVDDDFVTLPVPSIPWDSSEEAYTYPPAAPAATLSPPPLHFVRRATLTGPALISSFHNREELQGLLRRVSAMEGTIV